MITLRAARRFGSARGVDLLFLYRLPAHAPSVDPPSAARGHRRRRLRLADDRRRPGPGGRIVAAAVQSPVASIRPSLPALSAFRLGTAAGFLGWSTAIGDFNTDGTPDAAIADSVSDADSGASYRIEFSVSGREPATVAFESEQDALTVRVSDVDHDNDLDIVVSGALTHAGRRGVAERRTRRVQPVRRAAVRVGNRTVPLAGRGRFLRRRSRTSGSRRMTWSASPCAVRWSAAIPRRSSISVQSTRLQPAILSSALSSRAPPPPPRSLLIRSGRLQPVSRMVGTVRLKADATPTRCDDRE